MTMNIAATIDTGKHQISRLAKDKRRLVDNDDGITSVFYRVTILNVVLVGHGCNRKKAAHIHCEVPEEPLCGKFGLSYS
jgi:hypothetical protein